MEYLDQHVESLVFAAEHPISLKEIKQCLEIQFETSIAEKTIIDSINSLQVKFQKPEFSFELCEIANGFQFLTKGAYHNTVGQLLKLHSKKKLSRAALETLSIIAYKQPISKSDVEKIRGVSCDYTIQKLLEKELLTILGRSDGPGRPLLYGTSERFMNYFGLKSIKDLPKIKDFKEVENQIGEQAPIEEPSPNDGSEQIDE